MTIKILTLVATIILSPCGLSETVKLTNGFDAACLIFYEAEELDLSPQELGIHISTQLEKITDANGGKEVLSVYHAVFNISPRHRYNLFKESAETMLKRNWDCNSIKTLYEQNNP